jgi:hypothetical protein
VAANNRPSQKPVRVMKTDSTQGNAAVKPQNETWEEF